MRRGVARVSSVLWANYLRGGRVVTDSSDKYALYKFSRKLDALCARRGVALLSSLHDTTDYLFNIGDSELPEGMEDTDQLMARDGLWVDSASAVHTLETLLETITSGQVRFGLMRDAHDDVVTELEEAIRFARTARDLGALFNFSVVM